MNQYTTTAVRPSVRLLALLFVPLTLCVLLLGRPAAAGSDAPGRVFLPVAVGRPAFGATPLGNGFNQVTEVTHAGDDRLFVAERAGVVKILHPDGRITTFLDIRQRVISHSGEYGFFDVAFHPGYADPASPGYGFFYVSYTTGKDDGVIIDVRFVVSRFRVSADPNVADPASEVILQYEKQSFNVHKAGGMDFDKRNNMLYVGMGDDRLLIIAQQDGKPKGKIFRLDVDRVPRDARGVATLAEEIWVYGLRNPWRFDLDEASGALFIGEVGDYLWEEINLSPISVRGYNFGWPCMEGGFVFPETADYAECKNWHTFARAIHEYPHRDGSGRCAVIGGKVNRPAHNPNDGRFIFTDMCSREVFALARDGSGRWQRTLLGVVDTDLINTLGEDRHGYQVVGTAAASAPIYRLYIP
jgi:glucose/arabinose dehydrogenase